MRRATVIVFTTLLISTAACIQGLEAEHKSENLITIASSGERETYECKGQNVVITGNDNHITLTGTCESLTVSGLDNEIKAAQVDVITVTGKNNRIAWARGEGDRPPAVTNAGINNVVEKGE